MLRFRRRLLLAALLLPAAITAPMLVARGAQAADVRVLTAGAFRPVLEAVVPAFESRNGSKVLVTTDTAGGVAARIGRGEPFDVVVLTPAAADAPMRDGQIILLTPIATVGVGAAVKAGAPKPDISSVAALKAALLAAPKVAMVDPASGGTSGAFLMTLFDKLGIADDMKPKLVLTPGGLSAERLLNGEATLALGQISELVAVGGATLVGPLPPDAQQRTTYAAAINPKAADAPLVLLAILAGPETASVLPKFGMNPP